MSHIAEYFRLGFGWQVQEGDELLGGRGHGLGASNRTHSTAVGLGDGDAKLVEASLVMVSFGSAGRK